jgi:hypothetical protein
MSALENAAFLVISKTAYLTLMYHVDRGIRQAKLVELPYVAELAAVRLARPLAHEILQNLHALRDEAERALTPDGTAKFSVFVAGWLEP